MAQFVDAPSLILAQTAISFVTAPFTSPSYNLPIFLFGIYAAERTESTDSLRLFSGLLSLSILFDFIWLLRPPHASGFITLVIIINMLLKAPTFFAVIQSLRHRGASFGSFIPGEFPGSQNVWSMPGGFGAGSREGYQTVGDDLESQALPAQQPQSQHAAQAPANPPGGYTSL